MGKAYIGIDPSLRHTGVCVIDPEQVRPFFFEVKTEGLSILGSCEKLKGELMGGLWQCQQRFLLEDAVVGIERQVPGSGMLYHAMMSVIEALTSQSSIDRGRWLVMPLPVQLRAYMQKRLRLDISKKSTVVKEVQEILGNPSGRFSSHKADAYCVALMAKDVSEGQWPLRLPAKETHLVPPEWVFGEK